MSNCNDFLETKVVQEGKPVSYKFLARSLDISTIAAKKALNDFYATQKNLWAIYCISGTKLSGKEIGVQLVKERELEAEKKKYQSVSSSYIYSIASYNINDFSILCTSLMDIPKGNQADCAPLKNSSLQRKIIVQPLTDPQVPSREDTNTSKQLDADPHGGTKRKNSTQIEKLAAKKATVQSPTEKKKTISRQNAASGKLDKVDTNAVSTQLESSLKVSSGEEDEDQERPILPTEEEDYTMMDIDEPKNINSLEPKPIEHKPGVKMVPYFEKVQTENSRGLMVTEEVTKYREQVIDDADKKPAIKNSFSSKAPTTKHTPKTNTKKPTAAVKTKPISSFFQPKK